MNKMLSAFPMDGKRRKKCLFVSVILSTVTIVFLLISGSSNFGSVNISNGPAGIDNKYTLDTGELEVNHGLGTGNSRPLTSYGIIEHRFRERQKRVEETCKRQEYTQLRMGSSNLHFSPIARGRIAWCRIPKVGTTYLQGLEKKYLRGFLTEAYKSPNKKTVMFVREPYSRLVSGYLGKIVTNQPWWKSYGTAIVKRFRPRATDRAKKCGNDVTFPEFLKYFIATQVDRFKPNSHWTPLHKQCNPCKKEYDFIGHLETFKDDLSHVFKAVNVSVDMDFNDEEQTMRGKAATIIYQRKKIQKCESMSSALRKVWWSFHARGLISTDIQLPLSQGECDVINSTAFADLAWDAHIQSMGSIDKYKQRRDIMAKLYLQAPLADRLKVRELLMKDFELYGYDSQPAELFPELSNSLG